MDRIHLHVLQYMYMHYNTCTCTIIHVHVLQYMYYNTCTCSTIHVHLLFVDMGESWQALSCHRAWSGEFSMCHMALNDRSAVTVKTYITSSITTAVYMLGHRPGSISCIVSSSVLGLSATFDMFFCHLAFQRPTSSCNSSPSGTRECGEFDRNKHQQS